MGNSIKNPFRSSKSDEEPVGDPGTAQQDMGSRSSSKSDKRSRSDKSTGASRPRPTAAPLKDAGGPPFTLDEAIELQGELRAAFAEKSFQTLLQRIRDQHQHHDIKGHDDHGAYMSDLQKLMLSVYNRILPKPPWQLSSGWLGARQMSARMANVMDHPRVKSLQDQIDALICSDLSGIGIEPLVFDTPDGSGDVVEYELPLVKDRDGDLAHEFLVMDRGTLRRRAGGPVTVVRPVVTATAAPTVTAPAPEPAKAASGGGGGKSRKSRKKAKGGVDGVD